VELNFSKSKMVIWGEKRKKIKEAKIPNQSNKPILLVRKQEMRREVSQFTSYSVAQCNHKEVVNKLLPLKGSCVLRKGLIGILDLPSKEGLWLLVPRGITWFGISGRK